MSKVTTEFDPEDVTPQLTDLADQLYANGGNEFAISGAIVADARAIDFLFIQDEVPQASLLSKVRAMQELLRCVEKAITPAVEN